MAWVATKRMKNVDPSPPERATGASVISRNVYILVRERRKNMSREKVEGKRD